jgi:hypothetical protein
VLPVISAFMNRGVPEGEPVVLDVAQLEALLSRTFGIGLDVGRGKEPVALVRLRLARALLGAAEANAVAAEAIAAERGIPAAAIAAAEGLALHAAAELGKAAEAAGGLIELARLTAASGRTGTTDLN